MVGKVRFGWLTIAKWRIILFTVGRNEMRAQKLANEPDNRKFINKGRIR